MDGNRMLWTEQQVEQLIELYKQHPLMWDRKHEHYRNRNRRYRTLKSISEALNMEAMDVERKINVLITQFRRTHKKIVHLRKAGVGTERAERNAWYGYKLLLFLENRNNLASIKNSELQIKRELPKELELVEISKEMTPIDVEETSQAKQKSKEKEHDTNMQVTCNQSGKDEFDLYGEMVAYKLKKMDEIVRIKTQHRINCVLYEAELKQLKKNSNFQPCSTASSSSASPTHAVSQTSFIQN